MTDERKTELFNELLYYIVNIVHDTEEVKNVLHCLGFTPQEVAYYEECGEL